MISTIFTSGLFKTDLNLNVQKAYVHIEVDYLRLKSYILTYFFYKKLFAANSPSVLYPVIKFECTITYNNVVSVYFVLFTGVLHVLPDTFTAAFHNEQPMCADGRQFSISLVSCDQVWMHHNWLCILFSLQVSYMSCLTHLQQLSIMNNPCVLMAANSPSVLYPLLLIYLQRFHNIEIDLSHAICWCTLLYGMPYALTQGMVDLLVTVQWPWREYITVRWLNSWWRLLRVNSMPHVIWHSYIPITLKKSVHGIANSI